MIEELNHDKLMKRYTIVCNANKELKDKLEQQKKEFLQLIDKEKRIVKAFCLGLAHPSQDKQRDFTDWLQDTVIFHLNQIKLKLEEDGMRNSLKHNILLLKSLKNTK